MNACSNHEASQKVLHLYAIAYFGIFVYCIMILDGCPDVHVFSYSAHQI